MKNQYDFNVKHDEFEDVQKCLFRRGFVWKCGSSKAWDARQWMTNLVFCVDFKKKTFGWNRYICKKNYSDFLNELERRRTKVSINVGDKVLRHAPCSSEAQRIGMRTGNNYTVVYCNGSNLKVAGFSAWFSVKNFTVLTKKGGETMNKTIVKLFPKTADAVLVQEELGGEITDSRVNTIVLTGHEEAILKAAQAKKAKREAQK